MGMFLNYQTISDNYIPNNLVNAFPTSVVESKLNPLNTSKPFEEYNSKGELTGYFWRYGETLNLEFTLDGEITVESTAIIMKSKGKKPTVKTLGKIGQRLYNIVDFTSWTCIAVMNGEYIWKQDDEFTYPQDSDRRIYISAEDYLKDKEVEVTIYNFRMEPVCKKIFSGEPTIIFPVDKELSMLLVKGIYYCSVTVFNSEVCYTVFDSNDCNLLVK